MEIGVYTFGDVRGDEGPARRLAELLEEARLADEEVGLDVFGVGEHHRPDYTVSTPAVVLAAIAARTKRIRLTSAVTVEDQPVHPRPLQQPLPVWLAVGGNPESAAPRRPCSDCRWRSRSSAAGRNGSFPSPSCTDAPAPRPRGARAQHQLAHLRRRYDGAGADEFFPPTRQ